MKPIVFVMFSTILIACATPDGEPVKGPDRMILDAHGEVGSIQAEGRLVIRQDVDGLILEGLDLHLANAIGITDIRLGTQCVAPAEGGECSADLIIETYDGVEYGTALARDLSMTIYLDSDRAWVNVDGMYIDVSAAR